MSFYKIAFISKPEMKWVETAGRSLITPDVVAKLLKGSGEEIVNDRQLDAICEWDRSIGKQSGTRSQLDYWPIEYTPLGRTFNPVTVKLTQSDQRLLKRKLS